ncbi:hypothetical protein [Polyangium jinanense]|uniref:Uncharacterized protein n=1 Tax=Polyangium jinanense TaxID=2829994 RepID=A0A9X4AVW4_9BACT|nr:hypothetical protein [Polyangium jinanense]MDC3960493.1 hypothetical protein [Polyangium jinanense]MDC3986734.1 hypothetical protein [Polyangium jinanense]
MLKIKQLQMHALADAETRDFEQRVLAHLRRCSPGKTEARSDEELRALIRDGLALAESYGILSERGVCLYIDLMVRFGEDFDRAPGLRWITQYLSDTSITDPEARILAVFDALHAYSDELDAHRHARRSN